MIESAAGILKIIIFLVLGVIFKKSGILKKSDIEGIKKVILYLAIPSVLFLSFSGLKFDLSFIPVTAAIVSINLILFLVGILLYRIGSSKNRIMTLCMGTMNFALIGIPLYEAVYGIENLNNYTMLGVGNEIFVWFIFFFLLRWFLSGGKAEKGINKDFIKSPIVWGIVFGCLFSIFNIDLASSSHPVVLGIYQTLNNASKLTTPLILIFIGFNISLSPQYLKKSLLITAVRLGFMLVVGYLLKIVLIDRFLQPTALSNAAFFLLITLPPVFALPILASDYIDSEEMFTLNNSIILHTLVTIILFSGYSFLVSM